jgi:hypothetical protein
MKEEMNTKVSGEEQIAATTAKEMNSIPTNAMFVVFEVFYTSIAGREYRSKYVFNELADAKKFVQERLDEYLVWTAEYHCIDLNDQDDYDDFYECLETTNDDEEMIYGLYPFDGDKNSLEYHIMEVKMFNEAERYQGLWCY